MRAPAKINLLLRVLSARPDGCHDIESVMQAIDFCDEVTVRTTALSASCDAPWEIACRTEGADLPENEANLAYRAALAFLKKYEIRCSVEIQIIKHIPLAAGLAGGSADAAAVLLALAAAHAPGTPLSEIAALGVSLGADIPFQLHACAKANPALGYAAEEFGTAVARGIGERFSPVYPAKKAYVLLVNPGTFVSAAEAYRLFDLCGKGTGGTDARILSAALTSGEEADVLSALANDLTAPVAEAHAEVAALMAQMDALCAHRGGRAMMSGSGPTVYGFFFRKEDADLAFEEARVLFPSMFSALAQTI
jgi:4-diphosphocytidyl-2-C-methyl-D-erythritol kinase